MTSVVSKKLTENIFPTIYRPSNRDFKFKTSGFLNYVENCYGSAVLFLHFLSCLRYILPFHSRSDVRYLLIMT